MRSRVLPTVVLAVVIVAACGSSKSAAPATTATTSKSCAEAIASGDVSAVLAAWRDARLRGSGAEACMAQAAVDQYCSPNHPCDDAVFERGTAPGSICLYSCHGFRITGLSVDTTGAKDGVTGA